MYRISAQKTKTHALSLVAFMCVTSMILTLYMLHNIEPYTSAWALQVGLLIVEVIGLIVCALEYCLRIMHYLSFKDSILPLVQVACQNANPGWDPNKKGNEMGGRNFTLFLALSRELQLRIWEIAVDDYPATIWYLHEKGAITLNRGQKLMQRFFKKGPTFTQQNPSLLQVCIDARRMARKRYELSFDIYSAFPIYFDYNKDFLCFSSLDTITTFSNFQHSFPGPASRDTDRVAKVWFVSRQDDGDQVLASMCTLFPGLKVLCIMDKNASQKEVEGRSDEEKKRRSQLRVMSVGEVSRRYRMDVEMAVRNGLRDLNLDAEAWVKPRIVAGTKAYWRERLEIWEKNYGKYGSLE